MTNEQIASDAGPTGQKMIFVVGILKDQSQVPPEEIERAISIRTKLAMQQESARGITRPH